MYHVSIKLRSQEGSLMHGSIYEIPGAFDPDNIDRLRIDRIGYARASEYSAITGVPLLTVIRKRCFPAICRYKAA